MDLNFSAEEVAFRDEVRAFVATHLPADIRDRVRHGDERHVADDLRRWQRILFEHGWGAAMWPAEFGGTGWDKTRQYLFENWVRSKPALWVSTQKARRLQELRKHLILKAWLRFCRS